MHPEIKKFWQDAGYRMVIYSSSKSFNSSRWRYYYILENKNGRIIDAGVSDPCSYDNANNDTSCKIYYLNNS